MNRPRRAWLALVSSAFSASLAAAANEDDARIVARSGDAVLTVRAVERRLASLSDAEIASLGAPRRDAPRKLVESVLALELGAELAARERGLDQGPRVAARTREILRQSLEQALRSETLAKSPVTDADITGYYEANRARFEQPERVRVWRILVNDEALAQRILDEAKKAGEPGKWSELCREHSLDKATNMRHGDLGFVRPDGTTDVPRVVVDAVLFRAAHRVKDGEIVPRPVAEGGKFAVLWRRGSLPAKTRTLAQERESIRKLLERRRVDDARTELLGRLRSEHVRNERVELLELVPEGVVGDDRAERARPAPQARPAEAGAEVPSPTDRGLR